MTALTLSHIELKGLHHGPDMQTTHSDDIFVPPQLKRCQSTTEYPVKHAPYYGDTRKKTRCSDGDLPEEIISLSYDLLNQIQRHEQFENRADSGISDVSSREDHSGSTVLSMSADSSTFQYNGYHPDVLSDLADDAASLSPLSSIDSPSYSEYSPCDSVAANSKKASKANKAGNVGPTKPLYTAELQVLCRICGDRASGFHYGVHSCEGCKGFFRRTLKKDLVYKPCRENAQCRIDTGTRNKCQYCRYQKCLNAGMSQNAVRFGRMPKAEREKLIADKEELSNTCSSRIMELRTLSDTIKGAFQDCFVQCKFVTNYLQGNAKQIHIKVEPDLRFSTDSLSGPMFAEQNIFQSFQEAIIPIIEGTVKFTKKIPKFSDLAMSDRITLLKQNCFCVPLILTYLMFENSTLFLEGKSSSVSVTDCGGHYQCLEAQCLFEGIFQISRKLIDMQLKLVEVALYCAIVLLVESPGIMSYSEVEILQQELLNSLRLELKHNHPKEKFLFARLLVLIPLLVQVTEEFRSNLKGQLFDNSNDFSRTHELVCEIFDLR